MASQLQQQKFEQAVDKTSDTHSRLSPNIGKSAIPGNTVNNKGYFQSVSGGPSGMSRATGGRSVTNAAPQPPNLGGGGSSSSSSSASSKGPAPNSAFVQGGILSPHNRSTRNVNNSVSGTRATLNPRSPRSPTQNISAEMMNNVNTSVYNTSDITHQSIISNAAGLDGNAASAGNRAILQAHTDTFREIMRRKEAEMQSLNASHFEELEAVIAKRDAEMNQLKQDFTRLQSDFKYNLQLLEERDKELQAYSLFGFNF